MSKLVKILIVYLIGLICGLTWYVEWSRTYYEVPGYLVVRQRLLNIEFIYTWPGFKSGSPPEWDLRKYKYDNLWRKRPPVELQEIK